MKLRSITRLASGLGIQLVCYFGLFLSLVVGARALSPHDFGIYASSVAMATFAGTVLTAGADRILLRILLREDRSAADGAVGIGPFVPAMAINLIALVAAIAAAALGLVQSNVLFIAVLAVATAGRILLSGFFKFSGDNSANVIATFGLQPLLVGAIFGAALLAEPQGGMASNIGWWITATLVAEGLQFIGLYLFARRRGFRVAGGGATDLRREGADHATTGLQISILAFLSQSALVAIAVGSLFLPAADMGIFTVAVRLSQLILFPFIGASLLIVPMSSRIYKSEQLPAAQQEVRTILRASFAIFLIGNIGFLLLGPWALHTIMGIADLRAYICTLILSAGNLGMALFGVGDQIMVTIGEHRRAYWISVWCGGILFSALLATALLTHQGLIGLAVATAVPILLRGFIAYLKARRLVPMPIAAFDR